MIKSYAHLFITCATAEERRFTKAFLFDVAPFEEIDEELIYIPLESEDSIPVSTLLDDLVFLLEEHMNKLALASRKFDCKLALVVKSPLPFNLEKCDRNILAFAKGIGATITIL